MESSNTSPKIGTKCKQTADTYGWVIPVDAAAWTAADKVMEGAVVFATCVKSGFWFQDVKWLKLRSVKLAALPLLILPTEFPLVGDKLLPEAKLCKPLSLTSWK